MIRKMTMWAVTALLALALAAPAVFAASPAFEECEAAGGDYQRVGPGQYECVILSNPGTDNPNAATPKKDAHTQTGQGGGGGEPSSDTSVMGVGRQ